MRKLERAAIHFERTKLKLDTVDLDSIMINVEEDVEALERDMIIMMMDLITLVIIWGLDMHTYTAKAATMNTVGEP